MFINTFANPIQQLYKYNYSNCWIEDDNSVSLL